MAEKEEVSSPMKNEVSGFAVEGHDSLDVFDWVATPDLIGLDYDMSRFGSVYHALNLYQNNSL